jgi:nicotinamidase-related amidase
METLVKNQTLTFPTHRLEVTTSLTWNTAETAVIVCDMWDKHTCKSAERRVAELAPKINDFITTMRSRGALIIHAPSQVISFYQGTPERQLAESAPFVQSPIPISWNDLDESREEKYPVDDTDWCDDTPKCPIAEIENKQAWPWTRQHPAVKILSGDAISDNGQEIYNLLESRGIKNTIMTGVHINRCVLGRPFGIRQMVMLGKNVVLAQDLTDSLYDTRQWPYVSHEQGTKLLIKHVEKYWCPSVTSSEIH